MPAKEKKYLQNKGFERNHICDCRIKTHPMSSSRIGSVGSNDPFGALTDKLKESKKNIINGKFFMILLLKTKQKYFSRVR